MCKVYGLYFSENDFKLEIRDFSEAKYFEGVVLYNSYYYISCDRKLLREKAREVLEEWKKKRECELVLLEKIKVKTKY